MGTVEKRSTVSHVEPPFPTRGNAIGHAGWDSTRGFRSTAIGETALETFLPLSKMRSMARELRASYAHADPFPHVVIDDFFDPGVLDAVLEEFPAPGDLPWRNFNNEFENKLFFSREAAFGPVTRLLMHHLNSITFLEFLEELTGIGDLVPDPTFDGGGLHQIEPGGKLGIHADFNRHKRYKLDRRLNALVYLNKFWRDEYGGHLELWDTAMTRCALKVAPLFNRMVVFSTTDFSYHGHPDPLRCPQGVTRKSLALYYYTNGRPAEEIRGDHTTLFQARREGEFARRPLASRIAWKVEKKYRKIKWFFRTGHFG